MQSKTLSEAFAKANQLPQADQERLGHELSDYIDHLGALRNDLTAGIRSLDAGLGRKLDIEDVIRRAHSMLHGGVQA